MNCRAQAEMLESCDSVPWPQTSKRHWEPAFHESIFGMSGEIDKTWLTRAKEQLVVIRVEVFLNGPERFQIIGNRDKAVVDDHDLVADLQGRGSVSDDHHHGIG